LVSAAEAFFDAAPLGAGCFDGIALEAGDLRDFPAPRSLISNLPVSGQWHARDALSPAAAQNLSGAPPMRQSR